MSGWPVLATSLEVAAWNLARLYLEKQISLKLALATLQTLSQPGELPGIAPFHPPADLRTADPGTP